MAVQHKEWQWCSFLHGVVFSSLLLSSHLFYSTPLLSTTLYSSLSTLLSSPDFSLSTPIHSPHVLPTPLYFISSAVFSTIIFRSVILCSVVPRIWHSGCLFWCRRFLNLSFTCCDVREVFFLDDILLCKYSIVYLHSTRTVRTYVLSFIEILDFLSPDSTSSKFCFKKTSWLL